MNLPCFAFGFSAVLGLTAATSPAVQGPAPPAPRLAPTPNPGSDRLGNRLEHAIHVDGRTLHATVTVLAGGEGESSGGSHSLVGMAAANVVIDAWSQIPGGAPGFESYGFPVGAPIDLNMIVKTSVGGAPGLCLDYLLVPCGVSAIPPVPMPVMFIDDVAIGPLPPLALIVVTITLPPGFLAPFMGTFVDWFSVLDYSGGGNPDTDGDGFPDCAIELGPAMIVKLGTPASVDLDEVGAEVFELFFPGPPTVDVYQPLSPPLLAPRAPLPTMPGEDGETRPWCFSVM